MILSSLNKPSAFLPILMSLSSLGLVLLHFARYGNVHEEDEGTSAHIFQILMVAQVPIIAFFAIKWLPENPREALKILALQSIAIIGALAGVFFLTS